MSQSDNQRSKVYRAEGILTNHFKSKLGLKILGDGCLAPTPSINDCQRYIKKVSNYEWFTARWRIYYPSYVPDRVPNVGDGRGRGSACWERGTYTIKLPTFARNEANILHEMAHWILDFATVPRSDGSTGFWVAQYDPDHAAHGKEFASVFLELVRLQLGVKATKVLKASYKQHRVKRDPQPQPIHRKAQQVA